MTLFEVFVVSGELAIVKEKLLSEEVIQETNAQVMTQDEAAAVGFAGIPDDPEGRPRLFVACGERDARLIHTRLEASPLCGAFKIHNLDG